MPAIKRRRLNSSETVQINSQLVSALPDVLGEIDLGIGLRHRLAATLESRITWALCLQEALTKESNASACLSSFKDAAFDALEAIEAPVQHLLAHKLSAPERKQPSKVPRPPPKPKQPPIRNTNAKFVYIRSSNAPNVTSISPDQVPEAYLLRCSVCQRSKFSSLQGLLNHGRISHKLEWGTHDECVRACAVVEPGLDLALGQEVGLGPKGILPGLRSLFEKAVGAGPPESVPHTFSPDQQPQSSATPTEQTRESRPLSPELEETSGEGVHLMRTLGLHKDTPALAPFLGRVPIKRQIRVWDTEDFIDVDGFSDSDRGKSSSLGPRNTGRHPWKASYARRNDVSDLPVKGPAKPIELPPVIAFKASDLMQDITHSSEKSRFHFPVRVIIADRSLWIPPDKRVKGEELHTHRWMVSVDSPSYTRNITTVLQQLKVRHPGSDEPELIANEPPFVVVGATKEPFLAQIDLVFNEINDGSGLVAKQTASFEHWVELELLNSPNIVLGDEQMVDIELDRLTVVGPIRPGHSPLPQKVLWDLMRGVMSNSEASKPKVEQEEATDVDDWDPILTQLLPKCPMTLKDVRGRMPNPPPAYKLVSSPKQFLKLIPGRRKAIEWGRSLALRDLYMQTINELSVDQRPPSLSTGDVFSWLSERGHFPRPQSSKARITADDHQESQPVEIPEKWCPICGIKSELHALVKQEADSQSLDKGDTETYLGPLARLESSGWVCNIVPQEAHVNRMPLLGVRHFSCRTRDLPPCRKDLRPSNLLVVMEPQLVMGIYNIVSQLKLSTFQTTSDNPRTPEDMVHYPVDTFGEHRNDVEVNLAPHALLGLLANSFIKTLVSGGLNTARKDRATVEQKGRRKRKDNFVSMLTPAHVLRGVIDRHRQRRHSLDLAVFECLSRIGTTVDMNSLKTGLDSGFGSSGGGLMGGLGGVEERLNIKVEQV
ncbi:hypothetical protein BDN72DRAFT_893321 [Pluteus cervinus]|uniref:Uncharacterized protein n=1 Tax=Pluteus cervinus TaxID=181527 RepID=A0ACD3B8D5_9AGAR|nr:hypothetical protein BDN72DRAFT_893321 [Pluteus cervinus]